MEEKKCFICFDSDNLVKLECACVELFVHKDCILKWLENKDNECAVCKFSYKNIVLKSYSRKFTESFWILVFLLSLFGWGSFMFVEGFISDPQTKQLMMWGCLCLLVSSVSIIAMFMSILHKRNAPQRRYIMKS